MKMETILRDRWSAPPRVIQLTNSFLPSEQYAASKCWNHYSILFKQACHGSILLQRVTSSHKMECSSSFKFWTVFLQLCDNRFFLNKCNPPVRQMYISRTCHFFPLSTKLLTSANKQNATSLASYAQTHTHTHTVHRGKYTHTARLPGSGWCVVLRETVPYAV